MRFPAQAGARDAVAALEAAPEALGTEICARGGLLLIPGMQEISDEPELLLRLSKRLGPEVDYRRNDNRNLLHSGTWYDADAHIRIMWRTTVRGNPDPAYAGERCTWVPDVDFKPS